jgi:hypothetical protein
MPDTNLTDIDAIKADIQALSLPSGRRVGQPGHDVARDFLVRRLVDLDLDCFADDSLILPYSARDEESMVQTEFANIVGRIPGSQPSLPPVLVGAHYDSVLDGPCSDDNAAAVAIALAVAEQIKGLPLARDVIIAIFDAEEPPFFHSAAMGSTRFCEDHCGDIAFAAVIIMDSVGHDVEMGDPMLDRLAPALKKLLFVTGCESHSALPPIVERVTKGAKGLHVVPTLNDYVGDMSDHHSFRLAGHPYLFLSCGRGRHYHTLEDTPAWINYEKVVRIAAFVLGIVSGIDEHSLPTGNTDSDTTEFEIKMLKRALGLAWQPLCGMLGIDEPRSRQDLNLFVQQLAGAFEV